MSEKKVLIVDDAVFMRSMQKRIISGSGDYEVYEAGDGEEAVVLYEKLRPGLVLLDISMPGMNGIEALKRMREIDENAFVIMCSAIGQESMVKEAVDCGARDFIVKPFKAEQIVQALNRAFPSSAEV